MAKQAYFFAAGPAVAVAEGFSLRAAVAGDIEALRRESGDFPKPVERRVESLSCS
ncbi:MAG: hypothetical protein U0232_22230 [Thermomicrobiales bacterium]